jgi:hypothetical protein
MAPMTIDLVARLAVEATLHAFGGARDVHTALHDSVASSWR